jgi:hypothetical protein
VEYSGNARRAQGRIGFVLSFGGLWWALVGFGGLWWALVGFGGLWWALVGFGGLWWALVGFGGLWWALVGFWLKACVFFLLSFNLSTKMSETSQVFNGEAGPKKELGQQGWASCTIPKSGLVELGNWCNAKIVQVSCVEACTLRLPSSGLYGFSCLVVVVASAGQDVLLDLNGHEVKTCLNGQNTFEGGMGGSVGSLLVSPVVGTRLEFKCDGQSWFIYSDYSRSLPLAATNGNGYTLWLDSAIKAQSTLISPININRDVRVGMFSNLSPKCKIYKIVNAQTFEFYFNFVNQQLQEQMFFVSSIISANDSSVSTLNQHIVQLNAGNQNTTAVGDSFMIVYNGSKWFICGSTFGNAYSYEPDNPGI